MMRFRSHRVPEDLAVSRLAKAREQLDEIPFDLTISNPTSCNLPYPDDLLEALSHRRGLDHDPDPRGSLTTREAVARDYRKWNIEVDPDRVCLTASTSEAYGFLFRLLADPGEKVLVPAPSYPLFEQLARLDGVEAQSYSLDPDTGWRIDFSTLEEARDDVRAVVVVHPNNPTGSFVHPEDTQRLVKLCRDRGWALIADEVFLSFGLDGGPGDDHSFAGTEECLSFSLGGLSKSLGLPQLKLAWIVASGPPDSVEHALEGLEYVADAYLSVSTPVSLATPELLSRKGSLGTSITERCRTNLETLRARTAEFPFVSVSETGGGWSAVLRVPAVLEDEELCLKLLEDHGVAVHPGYLFQCPSPGYLVLSLLPPETEFAGGVEQLLQGLDAIVNEQSSSSSLKHQTHSPATAATSTDRKLQMDPKKWIYGAASLIGILSLTAGAWVAQYTSPWRIFSHAIDKRLRFLVSEPTEVLAAFFLMLFGAVVLARLSSRRLSALRMSDHLPRIRFTVSTRGLVLIIASAMALGVLCALLSGDRANIWDPFLFAAALILSAFGVNSLDTASNSPTDQRLLTRLDALSVSIAVIVAAWAASRRLSDWYFSWIGDEGAFFNAARFLAEGGPLSLFDLTYVYETHPVVDSAYQSVFLRLFGHHVVGWRLAEVAVAAIAAALVYLVFVHLVRTPSPRRTTMVRLPALIGGFVVGTSSFTMAFCHIGYNNLHAMIPPLLAMLILARISRRPRAIQLLALGWTLGLCLYTFLAAVLTWIVVVIFLAPRVLRTPLKAQIAAITLVAAGFTTVVLPAVLTNSNPLLASFEQSKSVGFSGAEFQIDDGAKGFVRTAISFWRNEEWFHHYVGGPLLGPIGGALAFLGLITAWIARRRSPGDRFLLIWFFTGIVVIAFTNYTDHPSFTRLLFVMPALALFAGRGAMVVAEIFRNRLHIPTLPTTVGFLVLLTLVPATNLHQLHVRTPERLPAHRQSFTIRALQEYPGQPVIEIAREIEQNRNLVVSFYPWYAERHSWTVLSDDQSDVPKIDPNAIILVYDDALVPAARGILGSRWKSRRYPDTRYHGAIWIFEPSKGEISDEIGP